MTQNLEVFGYSSDRAAAELAFAKKNLEAPRQPMRPSTALYWQEEIDRLTELRDALLVLEAAHGTATNFAIAPGTTNGYLTVSGPGGGYVYTFDALADGTRQSNGG